jgi:deoxycytidylate deaminase
LEHVRATLEAELADLGYTIAPIKVSDHFSKLAKEFHIPESAAGPNTNFSRTWGRQDLGNALRDVLGDDLGAQIALSEIAVDRANRHQDKPVDEIKPGRVAYIIDQLKNPSEATLLRDVYGNIFFLVGVLCGYDRRKSNLTKLMKPEEAEQLIERDRAESGNRGQQLEKTLKLADFFVRNSHHNTQELKVPVKRFVRLLHGENGITPTKHERGMHAAYSASLRSACLSRQVGAAIMDDQGNLLSTGCNDVPKAGGGLYETGAPDHRCVFREGGLCYNDRYKDQLRDDISRILAAEGIDPEKAKSIAAKIKKDTRLGSLIEFSRAVHAEMDAIVAAARKGGASVQNSVLFTTTYPCHNCARHIVAAGVREVYFIEPYGKSLASELHDDAIVHDPDIEAGLFAGGDARGRVAFLHFEGVAPTRFDELFCALDGRKRSDGSAIPFVVGASSQKTPELLDNYRELEARVIKRISERTAARAINTENNQA